MSLTHSQAFIVRSTLNASALDLALTSFVHDKPYVARFWQHPPLMSNTTFAGSHFILHLSAMLANFAVDLAWPCEHSDLDNLGVAFAWPLPCAAHSRGFDNFNRVSS